MFKDMEERFLHGPFKNIEYKIFVENKGDRVLADYWSLAEEELQSLKSVLPERQKGGNLV